MPPIERVCKITNKKFFVSDLEQKLRAQFDAPLPDVHPYERMKYLMNYRNVFSLYNDTCDLCKKHTLSLWGDSADFPVYCKECWYSDKWIPPQMDLDLDQPFFDQFAELMGKSPHPARAVNDPIVNSDYCNAATNIKNCYWSFHIQLSEDCYYCYDSRELKNCVSTMLTNGAEFLYDCLSCYNSYQVFWSDFAINCTESYYLYDCVDCDHCALSAGLRHKSYIFLNEQLSPEQYEEKVKDLQTGSYAKYQEYWRKFDDMRKAYRKKYLVGLRNENVEGNFIFDSENIEESFKMDKCEDCVSAMYMTNTKDALDVISFGCFGAEKI